MKTLLLTTLILTLPAIPGNPWQAQAQTAKATYPAMAPVDQYLMDRDAEIAMARTAAPESVSHDADILVMGKRGYETAIKGKNGFVCMVQRSWTSGSDFPEFWNPKLRAPICFNPPAARSYMLQAVRKTEWVLAGRSKAEVFASLAAALDKDELPPPEPGAMCYMMSKQQYLNDGATAWHPHLMFFVPFTEPVAWGAGLSGSPLIADKDVEGRVTVFMVTVPHWSDGTPATAMSMSGH